MMELLLADGGQFASQIQEEVPLETVQGVRDRLNELVEGTEYVEKKVVSGRNLYRLTEGGEEYALRELRDRIA